MNKKKKPRNFFIISKNTTNSWRTKGCLLTKRKGKGGGGGGEAIDVPNIINILR
jgi:hypothetical protein